MYFLSYVYEDKENYGILNSDKSNIIPMDLLLKDLKIESPATLREFIELYSDSLIGQLNNLLAKFED